MIFKIEGGVLAEWFEALLVRQKKNEKPEDPRSGSTVKNRNAKFYYLYNVKLNA